MKVREFCKRFISREQKIVLVDENTNFIDETVDNLLLENSYYGDMEIKSVHSTTCRTFNPDKEEDVLALVISKEKVEMDRKTIIYYLKAIHDSRPTRATRERKALEEAINYIRTWDVVLADLQCEFDKNIEYISCGKYCEGLGFAIDIMNDDLELEKEKRNNGTM